MKKIFFILFIFTLQFINCIYADNLLYLKDIVYTSTNIIQINQLFKNDVNNNYHFMITKSRSFSNDELSMKLCSAGMKNFILIGNGVRVEYITQFSELNDIRAFILTNYPYLKINPSEFEKYLLFSLH